MSSKMEDACSFYRAAGVFRHLQAEGWHIDYFDSDRPPAEVRWSFVAPYSMIYMQRPSTPFEGQVAHTAKEMGIKIWADYDDDVFSVPLGNPARRYFVEKSVLERVDSFVRHAEYCTVSTEYLRDRLQGRRPTPIRVIPNAWDDYTFPEKLPTPKEFKSLWVWRGSSSHEPDMEESKEEFVKASTMFEGQKFVFLGTHYWPLVSALGYPESSSVVCLGPADPYTFVNSLHRASSDNHGKFGVVPLVDSPFNRAKSNIAWMEYTYANLATIAPYMPEWIRPGITNYTPEMGLADTYKDLAEYGNPSECIEQSWQYIMDTCPLSKVNKLRETVLMEAYG